MKAFLLRAFGVLLLLSALALGLSRAPDLPLEALVGRWAPPPSTFVDVKGQIVHLRDEGPQDDALPLVLIHGTSASLHTWEGWVKVLKPRKRVITMDLPAFGLTGPSAAGDYRGDTYARFVLDVLDQLKVQRFAIGGNSLGGEVAWRTAAMAPDRVERLILVDAGGLPFEPISVPLGWRIAMVPVLNRVMEEVLPRAIVAQGIANVYGHPERVSSELVDRYFDITRREGNRRALVQRLQQMDRGSDAERVKTLKLPTLILWGGRDRIIPPPIAKAFQADIAGSQLVMFDDLGHVPHEEDPARTLVPVLAFLGLK
jgi:pimeloyl-ACP methyl ester carboxylesterase